MPHFTIEMESTDVESLYLVSYRMDGCIGMVLTQCDCHDANYVDMQSGVSGPSLALLRICWLLKGGGLLVRLMNLLKQRLKNFQSYDLIEEC